MTTPTIIMVAPNGARKTHDDHPALPISIAETVAEASACFTAGASVLHAHVRGENDEHVLDAGRYIELIAELNQQLPDMLVQITTEAVGVYSPQQQVDCVKAVLPEMISAALREISSNYRQPAFARDFYHWCEESNTHVQHILYSADDLIQFQQYRSDNIIPYSQDCVLFVLGRYAVDFQSSPDDLKPFLQQNLESLDWFTCAFGQLEQACVISGIQQGGHARIGFENNLHRANGEVAESTAQLVEDLVTGLNDQGKPIAIGDDVRSILGIATPNRG